MPPTVVLGEAATYNHTVGSHHLNKHTVKPSLVEWVVNITRDGVVVIVLRLGILMLHIHSLSVNLHLHRQSFADKFHGIGGAEVLHLGRGAELYKVVGKDGYCIFVLALRYGAQSLGQRRVAKFVRNLRHADYGP